MIVEAIACGAAAAPVVWYWLWLTETTEGLSPAVRASAFAISVIPSYGVFALLLLGTSAATAMLTGARTPSGAELRIRDFDWPLLTWARYMASIHVARMLAGPIVRSSPIWSAYLRANGARVGRRVYVNTLSISDHNLLEFGDDVVIGADVHVSGHTVERGLLKTGTVRFGHNVTIGLSSVIEIDVIIGDGAQVGALSFVPKHAVLEPGRVFAGIPVAPLPPHADSTARDTGARDASSPRASRLSEQMR